MQILQFSDHTACHHARGTLHCWQKHQRSAYRYGLVLLCHVCPQIHVRLYIRYSCKNFEVYHCTVASTVYAIQETVSTALGQRAYLYHSTPLAIKIIM